MVFDILSQEIDERLMVRSTFNSIEYTASISKNVAFFFLSVSY